MKSKDRTAVPFYKKVEVAIVLVVMGVVELILAAARTIKGKRRAKRGDVI